MWVQLAKLQNTFIAIKSQPVDSFPFNKFFENIPSPPLFKSNSNSESNSNTNTGDVTIAHGCIRHIVHVFEELRDYKGYELLRSQAHRSDYMLMKQVCIYVYMGVYVYICDVALFVSK